MSPDSRLQHHSLFQSDGLSRHSTDSTLFSHEADIELGHCGHTNSNGEAFTGESAAHVTIAAREPSLDDHDDLDQSAPFLHRLHRPRSWRAEGLSSPGGSKGVIRSRICCLGSSSSQLGVKVGPKLGFRSRAICLIKLFIMFLGTVQLASLLIGLMLAFLPGPMQGLYQMWNKQKDGDRSTHWPTDYTADILPVRCHSHNDYWRKVPLISAVKAGCTGVEADVWLYNDDLYVGHTPSSLTVNRTFQSLYVNPLVKMLEEQNPITEFQPDTRSPRNGVFDVDADQSLVLLIDFKTNGPELWPVVQAQLEPLRAKRYLSYFNGKELVAGPITVVTTGNAPFDKVIANMTYRDMFFDAPLAALASITSHVSMEQSIYDPAAERTYLQTISTVSVSMSSEETDKGQGYSGPTPADPSIYTKYNSYYASTSLKATIGWPFPYFNSLQRSRVEAQVRGAHAQGLQVRYWGVPDWPVSWRNYLWRELVVMGIDYLNVDDLEAASRGSWKSEGSYGRAIWGDGSW